jgi:hypothetical protein
MMRTGGKEQATKKGSATMVEETFYLPYQASPYVLSFLFSACREIHRTFAHAPDHAVLHYLASQLLIGCVLCALAAALVVV